MNFFEQELRRFTGKDTAFKSIALRYVQKQPRMKTCKLSDIERITRVNWSSWGRTTPNLYGYEIVAKGRTFLIKAPRPNH